MGVGPSQLCETSAKVIKPSDGSVNICEKFVVKGREFGSLPLLQFVSCNDVTCSFLSEYIHIYIYILLYCDTCLKCQERSGTPGGRLLARQARNKQQNKGRPHGTASQCLGTHHDQ